MIVMENKLLTLEEVAQQLRVTRRTVKRYIALGQLEAVRVGGGYRVRPEALGRYIARNILPETDKKESHPHGGRNNLQQLGYF